MKTARTCILIIFLCFLFCSCTTPNMDTILAYQANGAEMDLSITDGTDFRLRLSYETDGVRITFAEGEAKDISYFITSKGEIFLTLKEDSLSLFPSLLKCKRWGKLLLLSPSESLWRIRKETLGGIAVYACTDQDGICVYVDCQTGFPLKMTFGETSIDVLAYRQASS